MATWGVSNCAQNSSLFALGKYASGAWLREISMELSQFRGERKLFYGLTARGTILFQRARPVQKLSSPRNHSVFSQIAARIRRMTGYGTSHDCKCSDYTRAKIARNLSTKSLVDEEYD